MKNNLKNYLQRLTDEELNALELEVLNATRDVTKNKYLKEINEEKKYRSFRREYLKAKKESNNKSKFINSNKIDLLAIYKYHEQGILTDYLEQYNLDQLKKVKSTLVNKYKFSYNHPIIREITINIEVLDYLNNIKNKIEKEKVVK